MLSQSYVEICVALGIGLLEGTVAWVYNSLQMELLLCGIMVTNGYFTGWKGKPRLDIRLHKRDLTLLQSLSIEFDGLVYGPYANYCLLRFTGQALVHIVAVIRQHMPQCHKLIQFNKWAELYSL